MIFLGLVLLRDLVPKSLKICLVVILEICSVGGFFWFRMWDLLRTESFEWPLGYIEWQMYDISQPNGRFETQTKICLSISQHHPEHWQPSWSGGWFSPSLSLFSCWYCYLSCSHCSYDHISLTPGKLGAKSMATRVQQVQSHKYILYPSSRFVTMLQHEYFSTTSSL
jgi:hypothetical protein